MISVTENQEFDGDITTSVIEFKTSEYSQDQLLAEMLCTVTDCSVDLLKKRKQINKAIIYGIALNYSTSKCKVSKMIIDFNNNNMAIIMLKEELGMCRTLS